MATVLVADDSGYARSRSRALLEEMGHQALEANDGVQAVQLVREARPDVVLLDLTMPVMDGLSALREIVDIDPTTRVVIVTATGQERLVLEAMKIGACDYVMKPFDPNRVRGVIASILSSDGGSEIEQD